MVAEDHAVLLSRPLQLSELRALATLRISFSAYTPDDMALLSALTSLRLLRLDNRHVPACLSELTWLERLEVCGSHEELADGKLYSMLPSFQGLACLSVAHWEYERIPPCLAGLSGLQRLCFDGDPADNADNSLPQCAWLASIRWLGLPWEALQLALPAGVLSHAARLEYLCVLPGDAYGRPAAIEGHPLWAFAATHPPLRFLGLQSYKTDGTELFTPDAIAVLKLLRPQLRLCYLKAAASEFQEEVMEADTIPE